MKTLKNCLLLLAVLTGAVSVYAQTAEEIIAKNIEATGGKEKLSAITSLRTENTITIMGGESPSTVTILNGKGYKSEADFQGQKVIQVYTDKSGWAVNPFAGVNDPTPMPEAAFKSGQDQIYVEPFIDYVARGDKAEYLGKEKVGAVEAHKVKITNHNNISYTCYFDPTTYYMIQMTNPAEFMGQPIEMKIIFSDFKKTDYGMTMPHTADIDFGGQFQMTTKVTKAEFNVPVDTAIFEMK